MKNWNGLDNAAAPVEHPRPKVRWRALSATLVTLVCFAAVDTIFPALKSWKIPFVPWTQVASHHAAFEWNEITATEHLVFHKCFDGFECAKLSLPLDYFNDSYPGHTVSIAITKLPAVVPVDDPRYGGPILLNPGGPGGAGAAFALTTAESVQAIVDPHLQPEHASTDARYFDIIGFDPRGIGWTEPAARCMPDLPSAWSWNLRETNEGLIGSSDAALGRLWSMTHAFGTSCKLAEEDQNDPDIKLYMSTASVARDMLEITERHDEYVAKEVARKAGNCRYNTYIPGKSKLQYWGYSYGTYLGSIFASMFPERVGRVILDGVVSSDDYEHSLGNGSLTDTEKAMKSFYTFCYHAGPDTCPLATANSSVADIEQRSQKILNSLYHDPLAIVSPQGPDFFTWSDLKILMFTSVYQPRILFPPLASLLSAIEAGGGPIIDRLADAYHYTHIYSCSADKTSTLDILDTIVPLTAVLCGDGIDRSDMTKEEFIEYWELINTLSPTGGSFWSMLAMRCAGWKIHAKYSFAGPVGGETSHPILFISNTADPVTPLLSGRYMHSQFPGSGFLVSDHAGHCSISSSDPCLFSHVRRYFQTGMLPGKGTVCVPPASAYSLNSTDPKSPFYDPELGNGNVLMLGDKDLGRGEWGTLRDAGLRLQRDVVKSGAFGLNLPGGEKGKVVMNMAVNLRW
ncbi:hypothetical protein PTNB73_05715 [Pyrenophora teres f. teres]|uniref:Abhydrolase-4 multi-domain protein n=1 Tax=Pyrenophora teres f. teres TaxID=97479 RepID=A0A6S6WAY2_9PLEO|nr:hypothetical protein PTNB73_05715 [Pyrenophora teres f. teres]CAE7202493.1 Abhydrolase-4 multi-domain protein [Pyrenophora teres f. teres]